MITWKMFNEVVQSTSVQYGINRGINSILLYALNNYQSRELYSPKAVTQRGQSQSN